MDGFVDFITDWKTLTGGGLAILGLVGWALKEIIKPILKRIGEKISKSHFDEAPTLVSPLHQLPPDLADFEGREEQTQKLLDQLTRRQGGAAVVSALGGLGGVGKSALAAHVGHRLKGDFPDAQIWVDMQGLSDEPLTPEAAMARVVQAFDPGFTPLEDPSQMVGIYRAVLAEKRALVILDNAKDGAQVQGLMPPSPSAAIVTSRTRMELQGVERIDLEALEMGEALDLLAAILGEGRATEEEMSRLAEACCRLPLALRAAGTYLKSRSDVTVADYIEALGGEKKRLRKLKFQDIDVGATLALSIRQLEKENKAQANRWRMLCVFPAEFAAYAAQAVWEMEDGDETGDALALLVERGLLLFYEDRRRYRLHDLMRELAGLEISSEDRHAASLRHAAIYMGVLGHANKLYKQGHDDVLAGLALYDAESVNIAAGQAWAAANAETDAAATNLCNLYPDAGAHVLDLRQHPLERIRWLEDALKAARKLDDREAEANHLGNLGEVHRTRGDLDKAEEHQLKSLELHKEMGRKEGMASDYGNLGLIYLTRGNLDKAEEHHLKSLAMEKDLGRKEGMAAEYNNLGVIYLTRGDLDKAEEHHLKSLAMEKDLGRKQGMASNYGNLGVIYRGRGDLDKAEEHHLKSLAMEKGLGRKEGMANQYGNLGALAEERGDKAKACQFWARSKTLYEEIGMPHRVEQVGGWMDELGC